MPKLSQNVVTVIDFLPFPQKLVDFKPLEKSSYSPLFNQFCCCAFSAKSFALFISSEFESDGALIRFLLSILVKSLNVFRG